ncbi:MAG: diguanylate cyclase [Bacilli bacterium]|nr:diguanylate cyclase [Bacilli bacterium]
MKQKFKKFIDYLSNIFTDDKERFIAQMKAVPFILGGTSFVMCIINIVMGLSSLAIWTGAFALSCAISIILLLINKNTLVVSEFLFIVSIFVLLTHFIIRGGVQGFSAIWVLLVPSCSMLMFGLLNGTVVSTVQYLILIFFFWFPSGKELLKCNDYTSTFLLRLPLIYGACFVCGFFFEFVRKRTYISMRKSQEQLKDNLRHDNLTGLLNQNAFIEDMMALEQENLDRPVGFIYIDINGLKYINDIYSHSEGDLTIRKVGAILNQIYDNYCYRVGSDEFGIVVFDLEEQEFNLSVSVLQDTFDIKEDLSVSIGGAYSPKFKNYKHTMLEAELKMKEEKESFYQNKKWEKKKIFESIKDLAKVRYNKEVK